MKQRYLHSAFAALVAARAQVEFSPTCSVQMITCLNAGMLNAGCKLNDLKCACVNQGAIKQDMVPCIESACSANELTHFVHLQTNYHCEDFDAMINAASGRASAAFHHEQLFDVNHISARVAAYPTDVPIFTGSIIVTPNDPTTPCGDDLPIPTETTVITTETPPYPLPSSITETPPANGTGVVTPTPSLPVFTDAAGTVKIGGVAVGLMVLGVVL